MAIAVTLLWQLFRMKKESKLEESQRWTLHLLYPSHALDINWRT